MKTNNASVTTQAKLLIIDDDLMLGETILAIGQHLGFNTRLCSAYSSFSELLTLWSPDYIVLDLIMPDKDGVEILQELAEKNCQAGIIITSGVGSRVLDAARHSAEERRLNVVGTLTKPFSAKEFAALVQQGTMSQNKQRTLKASIHFTLEDLKLALEKRLFRAVYQPKINCNTGLLAGFEVLARLHLQDKGHIPPDVFIQLAEQHDLIDPLTEIMLDKTLEWMRKSSYLPVEEAVSADTISRLNGLTVSVNISARSLQNRSLFNNVVQRCADLGISPGRLIFELTETGAMEDPVFSMDTLTRLRMQGFRLSIDDFGTGYSSMVQLVRLPFSEIKIDRSFVMTLNQSSESKIISRSIIELGHSLGLTVVAEGVEDQVTLDYLRQSGCHLAQGFFIARGLEHDQVSPWVTQHLRDWEQQRVQRSD